MAFHLYPGQPYPLGSTLIDDGVNFALFSEHAKRIELCIFDPLGRTEVARLTMPERTDDIWHGFLPNAGEGLIYGYRVHGPYSPQDGHRFNPHMLLLDPYAKKLDGQFRWSEHAFAYDQNSPSLDLVMSHVDNGPFAVKSVVVDENKISDTIVDVNAKPRVSWQNTVIYETHVKGFTQLNLAIPADIRGTFKGMAHPDVLHYIKQLGVTTVELLPVHSFIDEKFLVDQGLSNYWGYNTLNFFTPFSGYMRSDELHEFRSMVDAFHDVGLEVILDVVYNHTAEGNNLGPTLSFRGIDNVSYYVLDAKDKRIYANDTGCGNTLNVKHPRVLQMILDSLRYWVTVMGVDGFRFDLASVLGRESYGFDGRSGFFDAIMQDPVLGKCKLIAEPWDIGPGGYQLGAYPQGWHEWNDKYRDSVRKFWHGHSSVLPEMAKRIHGSSDCFEHNRNSPSSSINFITSHDGFTLHDLVSFNERHNLDNKENNRDGHKGNYSFNHGIEGDTADKSIILVRERQKRNFLTTLLLSQGTPMLLAGDEFGRTQRGNNNAYCQDNDINWIDWSKISEQGQELQAFVRHVLSIRSQYNFLRNKTYIHNDDEDKSTSMYWYTSDGDRMTSSDWSDPEGKMIIFLIEEFPQSQPQDDASVTLMLAMMNASSLPISCRLPKDIRSASWQRILDTNLSDGIPETDTYVHDDSVTVFEKSILILASSLH